MTPRAWSRSIRSSAPGSSGASVISRTGPASSRRSSSAGSGSRRPPQAVGAESGGERKGPSRCTPRIRGPRGRVRHGAERLDEVGLLGGDEGREVGGDARLEQRVAGRRVAVRVRAEEVDAGEAVHLEVDEAGHGDPLPPFALEPDAPRSGRPRSRRRPGRASRRRAPPRRRASRRRAPFGRRPPAPSSRARAVGASISRASATIATFASPSASSSAASTRSGGAPLAAATILRTRARSLSFVATTSTIRLPNVLPEPDHRDRRDHVEDELLRGARLEPRRAGDHLRADEDDDLVVRERRRAPSPRRETIATVVRSGRRAPRRARRGRRACGRSR